MLVQPSTGLCIVSTCGTFARKDTRLDTISSLVFLFYVGILDLHLGCFYNESKPEKGDEII